MAVRVLGDARVAVEETGRRPTGEAARACRAAGVRVAIEMHPNFVVYNPETMLRLREVAPRVIGCNFDPSHMFWQGVDPVIAIRALAEGIYHVHAKDCRIDEWNVMRNGVLDAKRYTRELERSWVFRDGRLRPRRADVERHRQHLAADRLRRRARASSTRTA